VSFYKLWHGAFHLPGAGILLHRTASFLPALQKYRLEITPATIVSVDFRDVSAFCWINHLLRDPFTENGLVSAIAARPNSRGICWDIGANAGLFSYILASTVACKKIEFFEPQPTLFQLAKDATSHMQNVRGHNCALSNFNGEAWFKLPKGDSTRCKIVPHSSLGPAEKAQIFSGDSLVARHQAEPPNLIKIDTEGHEKEVIAGLSATIKKMKPDIFFEHIDQNDQEIEAMCPAGYELFTVTNKSGKLERGLHRKLGHNSVFLPSSLN